MGWLASYDDKRACNKRTGPGGGTRRLHHKRSLISTDKRGLFMGPK